MSMKNTGPSKTGLSKLHLDLSHKNESMKAIPPEIITKFIKYICENASKHFNYELQQVQMNQMNISSIFVDSIENGEKVIDYINDMITHGLGHFIEIETGEDRQQYNRTITLFESVVDENRVTLQWANNSK